MKCWDGCLYDLQKACGYGHWHMIICNSCSETGPVRNRHASARTFSSVVKVFFMFVIKVEELVVIRHCYVPPVPSAPTLLSVSCRSEAQKLQIRALLGT